MDREEFHLTLLPNCRCGNKVRTQQVEERLPGGVHMTPTITCSSCGLSTHTKPGRFEACVDAWTELVAKGQSIDATYKDIIRQVQSQGKSKTNRTGTITQSISGYMLKHDMSSGFPLITTKKMAWKTIRVELEGFIRGITDKQWYQSRGCNVWNEWCSPDKVPYGHDETTQAAMLAERDLGPIYGAQWRHFNGEYNPVKQEMSGGVDQLANAVKILKTNPDNRRIIVNAWNPQQLSSMALVPCHYSFQLLANDGVLDLIWSQRSCDLFLGIPFNIASYGLLLELIAKEVGMKAGTLIGSLGDVHIYENHQDQIAEQLGRGEFSQPTLNLKDIGLFDWSWEDATLEGYESHPAIKAPIAV